MKLPVLIGTALWVASLPALAEPQTLQQAVERAIENAPALEGAGAMVDAARAGVDVARSASLPTAGLQAEVGALRTDFTTSTTDQIPRSIGVQAEWTVFSSGANEAQVDAAGFGLQAAEKQFLGAREAAALDAFEAYAGLWLAGEIFRLADEQVDTLSERMKEVEARFDQGTVTRTDIALTDARLASAQASREAARAALKAAEARLERLTGVSDPEIMGRPMLRFEPVGSLETVLARVLDRNPAIAATRADVDAADARIREARGRFGPKVSVKARASYGDEVFFFFEDPIADVGAFVTLEMPLVTGGQRSATERQARSHKTAAESSSRSVRLLVEEQVASLWHDIEARRAALRAAERAEYASRLAAEGADREFEAGLRTYVDALDAETEYRNAQAARARAEVQLLVSQARLLSLSLDLEEAVLDDGN